MSDLYCGAEVTGEPVENEEPGGGGNSRYAGINGCAGRIGDAPKRLSKHRLEGHQRGNAA